MSTDVKWERTLFFSILILGFAVRAMGSQFGLPHLYHADEPIVVNHAVAYGTGDLNPHFFKIPPLVSYILFIVFGFFYLLGRSVGLFAGLEDFQYLFVTDPTTFYLLGRIIFGALLGTMTVYVFYHLLKKNFSLRHALICSFLLAVCFLHVRDSHYLYADIPLLLVIVLGCFAIFKVLDRGTVRDYISSGFLIGLAVATKYNGVFLFIPFFVAHLAREGTRWNTLLSYRIVLTAVIALLTFIALNPYSVADFPYFLNELLGQAQAESRVGWTHHLTYSLSGAIGWPVLLFAGFGMLSAVFGSAKKKKLILLSFAFGYYAVLSLFSQPYDRYVLPLIPFALFFAGDFLVNLKNRCRIPRVAFTAFVLLVATPSLLKVYFSNQLLMRRDMRTVALEWIEENLEADSKIALGPQFFAPRLKMNVQQLEEKRKEMSRADWFGQAQGKRLELTIRHRKQDNRPAYELFFLKEHPEKSAFTFSKPMIPYDLAELKHQEIDYVVIARTSREDQGDFYRGLVQSAPLLKRFSPYRDQSRNEAIDPQPLTASPFLWEELRQREHNGHIIEVFQLAPD